MPSGQYLPALCDVSEAAANGKCLGLCAGAWERDVVLDDLGRVTRAAGEARSRADTYPIPEGFTGPVEWPLPPGKRFAVLLSHDIDEVRMLSPGSLPRTLVSSLRSLLRGTPRQALALPWRQARLLLGRCWGRRDPLFDVARVLRREKEFGFSSTFFLFAEKKHRFDGRGRDAYRRLLPDLVRAIRDAGGEVGLHGNWEGAESLSALRAQREHLEEVAGVPVRGNRFHNLRYLPDRTAAVLAEAGFSYDSTLGYPDCPGFRRGVAGPFPLVDAEDLVTQVLELPLVLMDTTLKERRYLGLSADDAWPLVEEVLEDVSRAGGVVSVLWHLQNLHPVTSGGYDTVYWRLLRWIADHDGIAGSFESLRAVCGVKAEGGCS